MYNFYISQQNFRIFEDFIGLHFLFRISCIYHLGFIKILNNLFLYSYYKLLDDNIIRLIGSDTTWYQLGVGLLVPSLDPQISNLRIEF